MEISGRMEYQEHFGRLMVDLIFMLRRPLWIPPEEEF